MTTTTDDLLDISAQLFWQSATPTSSTTQTRNMSWELHRKIRNENGLMDYKEATGDLAEKVSIIKGKVRTTGKVSHVRRGSKFSQEEDQAQEHAVGYHTGLCIIAIAEALQQHLDCPLNGVFKAVSQNLSELDHLVTFKQIIPNRSYPVDLTEINRKRPIWFQAHDRLQNIPAPSQSGSASTPDIYTSCPNRASGSATGKKNFTWSSANILCLVTTIYDSESYCQGSRA
ncbi:uncharacterized protein UHO2_00763 [Ustilago hordei]|uniref:uncharacterized protein n=1 Tax=Ustilago hordei TaxID=120017 RepID=UPI001A5B3460|nr:uncharacterized protein UHO2_00763 [Ustilago hordei]SYW73898.1 uncharacterized protein UHO2_00763 [Ustilago hordei]